MESVAVCWHRGGIGQVAMGGGRGVSRAGKCAARLRYLEPVSYTARECVKPSLISGNVQNIDRSVHGKTGTFGLVRCTSCFNDSHRVFSSGGYLQRARALLTSDALPECAVSRFGKGQPGARQPGGPPAT